MSDFKNHLQEEFTSEKLSQSQLNSLIQLQLQNKYAINSDRKKWIYSFAAVAMCAFLIYYNSFTFSLPAKVSEEIAYNHIKNMPSEVVTTDYEEINSSLTKLDFQVKSSPKLAGLHLIGARYCSIQGRIAAQIQLKDNLGKRFTLYQYQINSDFDKTELSLDKDGVKIKMWSEGNIHFGLAEDL